MIIKDRMKSTLMKHILLTIMLFSNILCANTQPTLFKKNPTLGLHFFYNDFLTHRFGNMEGGFGIDYIHGLTNNIDLVGTLNAS
ncbi:hypothetical protein MASR2M69_06140 [Bacteroidota bacterium]